MKKKHMKMDSSSSSAEVAVVATEDVVQALVDHLVDPMLPLKPSSTQRDLPPLPLQQSVSSQMHAVVLLYNYYHRKQYPELEFLDFETFCKVVVVANRRLLVHMKYMQGRNSESDGLDKQLSVTEKAIMDACNICKGLDAAKDISSMEGWCISKVAVFLVDSMMRKCVLLFSPTTEGVWSLIEKKCDCSNNSEGLLEAKKAKEKKKGSKKPLADDPSSDEARLEQLALSAVKDKTGNDPKDLMILESHTVYSLSEEKTTARFYIMKCNKSIKEDLVQVPVEEVVNSLRGPLVTKSSHDCTVTPVVEYFHLLPYAGIIGDWISRRVVPSVSQLIQEGQGNISMDLLPRETDPSSTAATEKLDGSNNCQTAGIKTSNSNLKEKNGHCPSSSPIIPYRRQNTDEGKPSTTVYHSIEEGNIPICLSEDVEKNTSTECALSPAKGGFADKALVDDLGSQPCNNKGTDLNAAGVNNIHNVGSSGRDLLPTRENNLVPFLSSFQNQDNVQTAMATKGKELLQTTLRVLLKKRDELTYQQRHLDDEIARCEKNLQKVLTGGEDELMLGIDSLIEACNDSCSRDTAGTRKAAYLHPQEQSLQSLKRRRLSEAVLHLQNACQELDDICCQNNWILPRYSVFPSDGGFRATVKAQEMDFECSGAGDVRPDPHTARESAAANILSKLRSMASQAQ